MAQYRIGIGNVIGTLLNTKVFSPFIY